MAKDNGAKDNGPKGKGGKAGDQTGTAPAEGGRVGQSDD
jgi:hypothetical protein